jgi:hypothetical protein
MLKLRIPKGLTRLRRAARLPGSSGWEAARINQVGCEDLNRFSAAPPCRHVMADDNTNHLQITSKMQAAAILRLLVLRGFRGNYC